MEAIRDIRNAALALGTAAVLSVAGLGFLLKTAASVTYADTGAPSADCSAVQASFDSAELTYLQAQQPQDQANAIGALSFWMNTWQDAGCDQSYGALNVMPNPSLLSIWD